MRKLTSNERKLVLEYAKKLLEDTTSGSYAQKFRDWITKQGLEIDMQKKNINITKNGQPFLEKDTTSFFRSSHLDSIANQVAKKLGKINDFSTSESSVNVMEELEIIREKALNKFQLLFDSWSSIWKPKILRLANKDSDIDGEQLWSEVIQDALDGVQLD
jgi:hypothetical protein